MTGKRPEGSRGRRMTARTLRPSHDCKFLQTRIVGCFACLSARCKFACVQTQAGSVANRERRQERPCVCRPRSPCASARIRTSDASLLPAHHRAMFLCAKMQSKSVLRDAENSLGCGRGEVKRFRRFAGSEYFCRTDNVDLRPGTCVVLPPCLPTESPAFDKPKTRSSV